MPNVFAADPANIFGCEPKPGDRLAVRMRGRLPFGGDADDQFDSPDAFDPDHLPDPGPFLTDHDVLTGDAHVSFHDVTTEIFERRGVYDMTFGYNLAKLNLDRRHPEAGYRYARDRDDPRIVRAAFAPTTPFCPQAHTLATGSFRAWNGLRDEYDYDRVRVRIDAMHHDSASINELLSGLEEELDRTGVIAEPAERPTEDAPPF